MPVKKQLIARAAVTLCFLLAPRRVQAQAPGTVEVQLQVTATAGPIQCVIAPSNAGQSAAVSCKKGTATVATITQTPAVDTTGVLVSVSSPAGTGLDSVTVLLKKTTATALVSWEVTANGTQKAGIF